MQVHRNVRETSEPQLSSEKSPQTEVEERDVFEESSERQEEPPPQEEPARQEAPVRQEETAEQDEPEEVTNPLRKDDGVALAPPQDAPVKLTCPTCVAPSGRCRRPHTRKEG